MDKPYRIECVEQFADRTQLPKGKSIEQICYFVCFYGSWVLAVTPQFYLFLDTFYADQKYPKNRNFGLLNQVESGQHFLELLSITAYQINFKAFSRNSSSALCLESAARPIPCQPSLHWCIILSKGASN